MALSRAKRAEVADDLMRDRDQIVTAGIAMAPES
jgi:hypothetical protein